VTTERSARWYRAPDLVVTVPARHLDARLHQRTGDSIVGSLFAAVSVGAAVLAIVGPTNPGIRYVSTAVAVCAALLGVTSSDATGRPQSSAVWSISSSTTSSISKPRDRDVLPAPQVTE